MSNNRMIQKGKLPLLLLAICSIYLVGCVSMLPQKETVSTHNSGAKSTLYEKLGGQEKLEEIANNFVNEIGFDKEIFPYFADSNINRFTEKLVEQLCVMSDGPCTYTGDTMEQVHTGMNITESHFNRTVDLFIQAMEQANIPHPLQNKLLKEMAKTRDQMLYR